MHRAPISPLLLIIVIVVIALVLAGRKTVKKVISEGRHHWTPDEQRATIKFYVENHKKEPQEFEEALLKLSRELAIKPNAVRAAVAAVGVLENPSGKPTKWKPSKQLVRVWEEYRGKKKAS